jgi:hypothetical protein
LIGFLDGDFLEDLQLLHGVDVPREELDRAEAAVVKQPGRCRSLPPSPPPLPTAAAAAPHHRSRQGEKRDRGREKEIRERGRERGGRREGEGG